MTTTSALLRIPRPSFPSVADIPGYSDILVTREMCNCIKADSATGPAMKRLTGK